MTDQSTVHADHSVQPLTVAIAIGDSLKDISTAQITGCFGFHRASMLS
jgi:hypothetical protein